MENLNMQIDYEAIQTCHVTDQGKLKGHFCKQFERA